MSPDLRRALHEALDIVIDAVAKEASGKGAAQAPKRRRITKKVHQMPDGIDPQTIDRARHVAKAAGFL